MLLLLAPVALVVLARVVCCPPSEDTERSNARTSRSYQYGAVNWNTPPVQTNHDYEYITRIRAARAQQEAEAEAQWSQRAAAVRQQQASRYTTSFYTTPDRSSTVYYKQPEPFNIGKTSQGSGFQSHTGATVKPPTPSSIGYPSAYTSTVAGSSSRTPGRSVQDERARQQAEIKRQVLPLPFAPNCDLTLFLLGPNPNSTSPSPTALSNR